jgi:preprotein translocase subunit SecE
MATKEDTKDNASSEAEQVSSLPVDPVPVGSPAPFDNVGTTEEAPVVFEGAAPANLGIERYVHAAFFASGVFGAYLIGKILAGIWNALATWPAAIRAVPGLLAYAEDQRPEFTMVVGALAAGALTLSAYRKPTVKQWSDDVAAELYKVHWPDRELVTNGTIVVIAASLFATVYIGLLDRIWAFITNLVYGA